MIDLYQLPLSHYCEKIRWTLAYKGLKHRLKNLLPGLHLKKAQALTGQSSLPIIVDGDTVVHDSSAIITYLDKTYPDRPLTPDSPGLREDALGWERFVDIEIGVPLRLLIYHYVLERPDIAIGFFAAGGPWYSNLYLRLIYPKLSARMRRYMKIDADSAQRAYDQINAALETLNRHLDERRFLVGENFTRADLAAAAMFAPVHMPAKYGLQWPTQIPDGLQQVVDDLTARTPWVNRLYADHR